MTHSPAFVKLVEDTKPNVKELTIDQARERLSANPDAIFVDVREESEWNAGHAAGAQHISKGVIERDIEAKITDKDAEVILYCGGGYRSVLAADTLQKMGYRNVASMDGGWRGWKASGAPVEGAPADGGENS